jgi:hypothetical protein
VYFVVDDLGRNGRIYREAAVETTDLGTVILDLLEGQYKNPIRVVAFNTVEKWSQDVSADVAHELRAGAAICNCATCRFSFRISSIGMRGNTTTCSCRFRCASAELWRSSAKTGSDRRQSTVSRFHRTGARNVDRQVPSGERWIHEINSAATASRIRRPQEKLADPEVCTQQHTASLHRSQQAIPPKWKNRMLWTERAPPASEGRFLEVQIAGIELAYFCQTSPISDDKFALLKVDRSRVSKLLQSAVDGGKGHAERFPQLSKGNGRLTGISVRQTGRASTIEQFAEKMSHTCQHASGAVVRYGFSKNGGIDQSLPPDSKPD